MPFDQPPPGGQDHYVDPLPSFDIGHLDDHVAPRGNKQNGNAKTKTNNNDSANTGKSNTAKQYDPVEVQYEGFMLEKAEPFVGAEPNWGRVVQRNMPFSSSKLAEMSKRVRIETKLDRMTVFSTLTADQSGVVERLIAKRQGEEKAKNAVWVLDSVRKYKERSYRWRTIKVTKIQIILKRQDKKAIQPGQKTTSSNAKAYQTNEIIDISEPPPKKKVDFDQGQTQTNNENKPKTGKTKKNGNNQQQQHRDDEPFANQRFTDPFEFGGLGQHQPHQMPDPFAHGGHDVNFGNEPMVSGGPPDPFGNLGLPQDNHQHQHHGHNNHMPPLPPPPLPEAPLPPIGAFPVDEWNRQQGQMHHHQQPRHHSLSRPPALRPSDTFDDNPFRPNNDILNRPPGEYELPPGALPGHQDSSRPPIRARSFTPGARYSSRDPSRDRDRDLDTTDLDRTQRRQDKAQRRSSKRMERKVDNLDDKFSELISKVDDWTLIQQQDDFYRERERDHRGRRRHREHDNYSSTSSVGSASYAGEDVWSAPASGGSFTPPETPPLEPVMFESSNGTLGLPRRKTISSSAGAGRTNYNTHHRRRPSYITSGGGYPRNSSDGITQVIVEPHRRYDPHRRRQSEVLVPLPVPVPSYAHSRSSRRPLLHHNSTWQPAGHNDYPNFPVAERQPARMVIQQQPLPVDDYEYEYALPSRWKTSRRDSVYRPTYVGGGGEVWDDQPAPRERVVYVERGGGGRRGSGY